MIMDWAVSFFALFFVDIGYVLYMQNVQKRKKIVASTYATLIFILNSVVIINFTEDKFLLIPAIIGAFAGTYAGMIIEDYRNK
jgi:uncharacterized membrane protein YfcA